MLLQGLHGGDMVGWQALSAMAPCKTWRGGLRWLLCHPCSGQGQWMPVAGRCQLSHHCCLCWGWDGATAAVGNWGRNARADKAMTPPCPQTQQ